MRGNITNREEIAKLWAWRCDFSVPTLNIFRMRVFGLVSSGVLASSKFSIISCLSGERDRGITIFDNDFKRASGDVLPHLDLFSHSQRLTMRFKGHMLKSYGEKYFEYLYKLWNIMQNIKIPMPQSMSQKRYHSPWERHSVQIHNNVVKIQKSLK